jgi:hypothetical protein
MRWVLCLLGWHNWWDASGGEFVCIDCGHSFAPVRRVYGSEPSRRSTGPPRSRRVRRDDACQETALMQSPVPEVPDQPSVPPTRRRASEAPSLHTPGLD